MSENLLLVIESIRSEIRKIETDEEWKLFKHLLCNHVGGTRPYCPTVKDKRQKIEAIEAAGMDANTEHLSKKIGVSRRRVQQLRRLLR
jgi:Mg2+ and Co2+ transporter CorA